MSKSKFDDPKYTPDPEKEVNEMKSPWYAVFCGFLAGLLQDDGFHYALINKRYGDAVGNILGWGLIVVVTYAVLESFTSSFFGQAINKAKNKKAAIFFATMVPYVIVYIVLWAFVKR